MGGDEEKREGRDHLKDAHRISESEHQTFLCDIQKIELEDDVTSHRLEESLHQKQKASRRYDEAQRSD